jgi:hypothetical protein
LAAPVIHVGETRWPRLGRSAPNAAPAPAADPRAFGMQFCIVRELINMDDAVTSEA